MEIVKGRITKGTQDHEQHFMERLQDRYQLSMSSIEYKWCCNNFTGVFTKNRNKTLGYVDFKRIRIWCLYERHDSCLRTCYPPIIATDPRELIKACFSPSVQYMANLVYDTYLREHELIPKRFDSTKDAAIYYFTNTMFPTLHIDRYKHGEIRVFKLMHQVSRVIYGTSDFIKLKLVIIPPHERKQ